MSFLVIVLPSARQDLEAAYLWLAGQTSLHAATWYNGLLDALNSLENFPARCPLAAESKSVPKETRQLLYGDRYHAYRILFIIRDDSVRILHIRHAARDKL